MLQTSFRYTISGSEDCSYKCYTGIYHIPKDDLYLPTLLQNYKTFNPNLFEFNNISEK